MAEHMSSAVRLPTQDPFSGDPLLVTRLENPANGNLFEGRFSLGWLTRLSPEQLDFVGLLLARRNNVQKLAADIGIAYNTARARFEEIVRALGAPADEEGPRAAKSRVRGVLERLAAGEIDSDEAGKELRG